MKSNKHCCTWLEVVVISVVVIILGVALYFTFSNIPVQQKTSIQNDNTNKMVAVSPVPNSAIKSATLSTVTLPTATLPTANVEIRRTANNAAMSIPSYYRKTYRPNKRTYVSKLIPIEIVDEYELREVHDKKKDHI